MFRITALFIAFSMAFAASANSAEPVVLGAYLSMTGGVASYGEMGWTGISVAKKMEPEVLGRPVEVRLVDTKSDKVESANAVNRLIEKDKVVAIIGEMISGNTLAGADLAERRKIPMISPTATNPLVTQKRTFVFRMCFIDTDQGKVAAKLAVNDLKAKTAAVILDISQDYSVALAKFFKDQFIASGGKIVSETMFKSNDREFTPQLSRIKESKPDIIYAPIYYTECALIAKQARAMDLNVPILAGDGVQAPELLELGGTAVEGLYFTTHFHRDMVDNERGKRFLDAYLKEYGKEADAFTAVAADTYFFILDAIKKANSTDSQKIRDAILEIKDFEGISGKISMQPNGDPIKAMVVNTVKDGKFAYVKTILP